MTASSIDNDFVTLNGVRHRNTGGTIYQFCFSKGINLPCFCYHEKLSIAGNCRMCLVEANGALAVACAMPLLSDMVIFTDSKRVRMAREGVLEFLLINHPLDCPICDQGGECDLQDISLLFGGDRGRFYEATKRSVANLNCCGPLIKTVMTRCIHCTRCVRFLNEVSGVFDLGLLGRGFSMEIGTYIENHWDHELSGNIIDLCPVGALTSMPYAFKARPWELAAIESVDVLDALASSIRVDVANNRVLRILPALTEDINEEWITNKARFCYDSFNAQRLNYPRVKVGSYFVVLSWASAIALFYDYLVFGEFTSVEAFVGSFLDLESTCGLKWFFNSLGCSNINYESNYGLSFDYRFSFLLTATLGDLEKFSLCFFLGVNLRMEAPLLHSRLRKSFLAGDHPFLCFSFCSSLEPTSFPIFNLGCSPKDLKSFVEGRSGFWARTVFDSTSIFCKALGFASTLYDKCSFFLGAGLLQRKDCAFILEAISYFMHQHGKLFSFSFNVIAPFLGRISAFELGALPGVHSSNYLEPSLGQKSFCYLLGTDNQVEAQATMLSTTTATSFTVYQGSFFEHSLFFDAVNLILPVSIYTERVSSFINMEGLLRRTAKAVAPYRFVYADWEILQALFFYKLSFFPQNFSIIPDFAFFKEFSRTLVDYSCLFFFNITENSFKHLYQPKAVVCGDWAVFFLSLNHRNSKIYNTVVARPFNHYYCSEQFSRHSKILSLCFTKADLPGFFKDVSGF